MKCHLVCSIGGLKAGAAAVGTFFALKKLGYEVTGMTGASGGSMFLPLLSKGVSMEDIIKAVEAIDQDSLLDNDMWQQIWDKITPWKRKGEARLTGIMRGNGLLFTFRKLYKQFGVETLENLPIPVGVVASRISVDDETAKLIESSPEYAFFFALENSHTVVFRDGNTADAVRASCSIPAVFRPYKIEGDLYVDGGTTSSLPALPAVDYFGAQNVIIADASGDAVDKVPSTSEVNSLVKTIIAVIRVAVAESTNEQLRRVADRLKDTEFTMKRLKFRELRQEMFNTKTFRKSVYEAYTYALKNIPQG